MLVHWHNAFKQCTILVRYVSGYLGEWLLTYAGASGGVAMWYEYHSNPKKVSAKMTIESKGFKGGL